MKYCQIIKFTDSFIFGNLHNSRHLLQFFLWNTSRLARLFVCQWFRMIDRNKIRIRHQLPERRFRMENSSIAQVWYIAEEYTRDFVSRCYIVVKPVASVIGLAISDMAVLLDCQSTCDINQEDMGKTTDNKTKSTHSTFGMVCMMIFIMPNWSKRITHRRDNLHRLK